MSRNLDSRSEVAVPIYDNEIRSQIKEIIRIQLSGNTKVRIIDKKQDNIYKKAKPGEKKVRVQDEIFAFLKNDKEKHLKNSQQKNKIIK
jgi:polyphosphate kinase